MGAHKCNANYDEMSMLLFEALGLGLLPLHLQALLFEVSLAGQLCAAPLLSLHIRLRAGPWKRRRQTSKGRAAQQGDASNEEWAHVITGTIRGGGALETPQEAACSVKLRHADSC